MSQAWQYYFITIIVFFSVRTMACWALNLQYGIAGIANFAFIIFQAVGAYAAAIATLGPASENAFQSYILGFDLGWGGALVFAMLAGGLLAALICTFALRPERRDFQAMVMFVVSIMALSLVTSQVWLFNGSSGLAGIPRPFEGIYEDQGVVAWGWFYAGVSIVLSLLVLWFVQRIARSPWGRQLRAMRENPELVDALGVDVKRQTFIVYVVGGAIAALSGAILVQFINAWSPGSWEVTETFLYFGAIIVGGLASNLGALVGSALMWTIVVEGLRYMPAFGPSGTSDAIQLMVAGVLTLLFLWFRPEGIFPEAKRRFPKKPRPSEVESA